MDRWDPFREAMSLRDAMDQLMRESVIRPSRALLGRGGGVAVDLNETADGYELCAQLPGWKPEDIDITVQGDAITISGKHQPDEKKEEGRSYHLRERAFASFSRSFSFPTPIDPEGVKADYENGELTLRIPKAERARPRRIQVTGRKAPAEKLDEMGMRDAALAEAPPDQYRKPKTTTTSTRAKAK